MSESTTNYCALPFAGMQIECDNEIKPCCLYRSEDAPQRFHISQHKQWWNSYLEPMRETVKNNQVDPGCQLCISNNNHPLRSAANDIFGTGARKRNMPQWLGVRFGNFCNLKCIMCNSENSSQIEQEYYKNKTAYNQQGIIFDKKVFTIIGPKVVKPGIVGPPEDRWWENEDQLQQIIELAKQARYINFAGGEPLIVSALYRMLDELPADSWITFNTNLTKLSDRAVQAFKKFKKVVISVSIDGTQEHHEYIRWGSNWADIDANIKTISKLDNVELEFSFLLQHTSVFTWPRLWQYLQQFDSHIVVSPVYVNTNGYDMMTQQSVAPADMEKFVQWHNQNSTPYDAEISQWINSYNYSELSHQEFKKYVAMIDSIRGCNFVDTFNPTW